MEDQQNPLNIPAQIPNPVSPIIKKQTSLRKIKEIIPTKFPLRNKEIKYIYLSVTLILATKLIYTISDSDLSFITQTINLSILLFILFLFFSVLLLFFSNQIYSKADTILSYLLQFSILSLSLTDSKNLNSIFGQQDTQALSNPIYIILLNTVYFFIDFGSKKTKMTRQIILIVFYSMYSFSCSRKYLSRMATDLLSILVFLGILWFTTHNNTRTESGSEFTDINSHPHIDHEANFQSIMIRCDFVQETIQKAFSKIQNKGVKRRLRGSLIEMRHIKQQLAQGNFKEFNFQSLELNEDEKTFISENFTTFTVFTKKNQRVSQLARTRMQRIVQINSIRKSSDSDIGFLLNGLAQNWNFDIWKVYEETGESISIIGRYLFRKWQIDTQMEIKQSSIQNFFTKLQTEYLDNPYHNACHAADTVNSFVYFIKNSFMVNQIEMLQILACFIACLGHDVGHPGLTNRYLINSRDKLALKYNDISILQNMHTSKIFSIMKQEGSDILQSLTGSDWVKARQIIIDMVLSTDMTKHFQALTRFKARTELNSLNVNKLQDRVFVFTIALKSADIGHTAKQTNIHVKWTELIIQEFFRQGDLEKANWLTVSMYCNRHTTNIARSQVGFIRNIALPLFSAWNDFLQSREIEENVLDQIKINIQYWEDSEIYKFKTLGNRVVNDHLIDKTNSFF